MKRIFYIFLIATMSLSSVTACSSSNGEVSYISVQANEIYKGTVSEIGSDYITISTDSGNAKISYTEDTEFVGFGRMGKGQRPMGGNPEEMSNGEEAGTPPERPEGNGEEVGTPPERPEGNGEETGTPPERPEGNGEEMGNPPEDMVKGTFEDVSINDEVEILVDENGVATTVTLLGREMAGMGGMSQAPTEYNSVNEYSSDTDVSGETISSIGKDENGVLVATEDVKVNLDNVNMSRVSEDSTGGDNASFYGVGANALVTAGVLNIANSVITTDSAGGTGVFSYGNGTAYVSDTTIKTSKDTSGGIHVAGGGTLYAWDLDVETNGESSASIRSDRGSGKMVVDGGTYTSNGVGSPAVYSTADITIHNAQLNATGSEAICIEGLNTIRLFDCNLTGNMKDLEQNDCTWNVILYQSMSGDSQIGNSTFEMVGGSLTAKNGGMFYTTNTESTFVLSDVDIVNASDSEFLLKCTGNINERGWGKSGDNGADCHFTAIKQTLEGDVLWDSISQLDFYLTDESKLTGSVYQDETAVVNVGNGYANMYIDKDSTWVVSGDSTLTSLYCEGEVVDSEGNIVSIVGTDGTVYVKGNSNYTVTVSSYSQSVDLKDASTLDSWESYKVEKA